MWLVLTLFLLAAGLVSRGAFLLHASAEELDPEISDRKARHGWALNYLGMICLLIAAAIYAL
jgi:hypothetical protein